MKRKKSTLHHLSFPNRFEIEMALQYEHNTKKIESFFRLQPFHSSRVESKMNRKTKREKPIPKQQQKQQKKRIQISHICAWHTQKTKTPTIIANMKMKLCYEFCLLSRLHWLGLAWRQRVHFIQLSHPNNCASSVSVQWK